MTIEYYTKQVYGTTMYYLADNDQARHLAALTGHKTINQREMVALSQLADIKFERVFEPVTVTA